MPNKVDASKIRIRQRGRTVSAEYRVEPPLAAPVRVCAIAHAPLMSGTRGRTTARISAARACLVAAEGIMAGASSEASLLRNLKHMPPAEAAKVLMQLAGKNPVADKLLARVYKRANEGDPRAVAVAEHLAVKVGAMLDRDDEVGFLGLASIASSLLPFIPKLIKKAVNIVGKVASNFPGAAKAIKGIISGAKAGDPNAKAHLAALPKAIALRNTMLNAAGQGRPAPGSRTGQPNIIVNVAPAKVNVAPAKVFAMPAAPAAPAKVFAMPALTPPAKREAPKGFWGRVFSTGK